MTPAKDLYCGRNPAELPAFTLAEAAAWLRVPASTVRAWTLGQTSGAGARSRRSQPVIEIAGRFQAGESIASLVDDHGVLREQVEEAIRYERVSYAA